MMKLKMTIQAKTKKVLRFKVPIVVKKDDVGYHAFSPPLRGLHVDGDTKEEALKIGIEAAKQHLECMIEQGDMIPLSLVNNEDISRSFLLEESIIYHIADIEIKY
jgi:predicted RNase H-like HicB family nuclease